MIEMFVRTKHKIDKRHEFALVVVNDDALWVSGENIFTSIELSHSALMLGIKSTRVLFP